MAAVNSVSSGSRLELGALRPRAVLMCGPVGGESGGVALQLRGAGEVAVSCQDPALLADLLATLHAAGSGEGSTASATFDILDSSPCQDLASSPPLGSDCFLTDTSDTPSHGEQDQGSESANSSSHKFSSKKVRPKATSPSRQGPQQCQVCNKVFGNASALAKHKLTHSDERKYGCPVCAKAFKRQDHLNGHMLTHRNKKPYECRAEGCGKSYCDARSLRRHAENHHSTPGNKSSCTSSSPGSSQSNGCIQFAGAAGDSKGGSSPDSGQGSTPSPTSSNTSKTADSPTNRSSPGSSSSSAASSPLGSKASPTATITNGLSASNVTKHNGLVSAHSTKLQSIVTKSAAGGGGAGGQGKGGGHVGQHKAKVGRLNGYQGSGSASQQVTLHSSSSSDSVSSASRQSEAGAGGAEAGGGQEGGGGAPGGKIISLQKPPRTWNIQAQQNQQRSNLLRGPPLIPPHRPPTEPRPVECNLCHRKFKNVPALNGHMRLHGGYFKKEAESKKLEKKEASGPPLQTASVSVRALIEEKIISRRAAPAPPVAANNEPQSPVALSSTSSGVTSFVAPAPPSHTSPATPVATSTAAAQEFLPPTPQQPKDGTLIELLKRGSKIAVKRSASDPGHQSPGPVLSFQSADFALSNMTFQQDDGEFFNPTLQADVYHVQDPAILLQPSTDNLQFSSTSEQLDDLATLDDYATVTASLQDGTTVQYPVNQQLQAVLDSPLPEGLAEFSTYHSTGPENTSTSKDVLGFQKEYIMYANSPHVGLSAPSPLPSPLKYHDSPSFTYPTPPASHEAQSPSLSQGTGQTHQILSPTTSTTLHSTDNFVEAPLTSTEVDEVRNSSSPLSAAFFTTTMSSAEEVEEALEEVLPGESIVHGDALDMYGLSDPSPPPQSPLCVTPLPSPGPNQHQPSATSQTFTTSSNITFQRQSFPPFQSQMMPNSEDPLLSSSPKDFGAKKRFDFGGYQSYKIISHGPIDANNPNITGILVEANGEYKLIQAASNQLPVSWLTGATHQIIPKESLTAIQQIKQGVIIKTPAAQNNPPNGQTHDHFQQAADNISIMVKTEHEESSNQSAEGIKQEPFAWDSPQHAHRKRPRSEAASYCYANQHQSRLRGSTDHYTPAPMLDPTRVAPGLYNEVSPSGDNISCCHQDGANFPNDSSDSNKTPRINVGSQFQAAIPDLRTHDIIYDREPSYEHLLWDPGINDTLDDNEVRMFMELAMCAAMPVGGHTREYALQVLGQCGGDTHAATLRLMASAGCEDEAAAYGTDSQRHTQRWTPDEVENFLSGLREHDKNFYKISKQVGSKSSKQCVQFYYFWKKVTKDYKNLYLRSWSPETTGERSSSKNSWRWLSKGSRPPSTPPGTPASESGDEFPCKLCGKVFNKVKSRSAHMKSHRPVDADSKRPKAEKSDSKLSGSEERQLRDSPIDNNHSKVQPP